MYNYLVQEPHLLIESSLKCHLNGINARYACFFFPGSRLNVVTSVAKGKRLGNSRTKTKKKTRTQFSWNDGMLCDAVSAKWNPMYQQLHENRLEPGAFLRRSPSFSFLRALGGSTLFFLAIASLRVVVDE